MVGGVIKAVVVLIPGRIEIRKVSLILLSLQIFVAGLLPKFLQVLESVLKVRTSCAMRGDGPRFGEF